MPSVLAYHRPESLSDALALLNEPSRRILAGGTLMVPEARVPSDGVELVDLQRVGLDTLDVTADHLRLGAMVRLGAVAGDGRVPTLLRDLARRELPSTLRNAATVGGTVAVCAQRGTGASDSVLVAGLLALDATVVTAPTPKAGGTADEALTEILARGLDGTIIVGVRCGLDCWGVIERTGRTPADVPIVAAVAARTTSGVRLALTGVASTPVLVDPSDPTAELEPPSDFRGTAGYRMHLAATLAARALAGLERKEARS